MQKKLALFASVTGGDENVTPTYNWTVSDGTIDSGQGTSTITIDTSTVERAPSPPRSTWAATTANAQHRRAARR
jgi:hypothetical protein